MTGAICNVLEIHLAEKKAFISCRQVSGHFISSIFRTLNVGVKECICIEIHLFLVFHWNCWFYVLNLIPVEVLEILVDKVNCVALKFITDTFKNSISVFWRVFMIVRVFSDNNHLTFRGNSIATKSMEAHMKLVGEKVRQLLLFPWWFIWMILSPWMHETCNIFLKI